jgi:hypothetical protein
VTRPAATIDVVYGEDRARLSRKNGAENMSIVRTIAMNLLRNAPTQTRTALHHHARRFSPSLEITVK